VSPSPAWPGLADLPVKAMTTDTLTVEPEVDTNLGRVLHTVMTRGRGPMWRENGPPSVAIPFAALPAIEPARRDAIAAEALRANDRYLLEFIEEYSFCPYARRGRELQQVARYVHYADTIDVAPLLALMAHVAADPSLIVVQVILPLIEVNPAKWRVFCQQVTARGNHDRHRDQWLVTAALHPELAYTERNAFSLIPLFRRAPDPTIQWVRKAPLDSLYAGRGRGSSYIAPEDIEALLQAPKPPPRPLYDRIAITNQRMARRLGLPFVERILAEYRDEARRNYADILMDPRYDEGPT